MSETSEIEVSKIESSLNLPLYNPWFTHIVWFLFNILFLFSLTTYRPKNWQHKHHFHLLINYTKSASESNKQMLFCWQFLSLQVCFLVYLIARCVLDGSVQNCRRVFQWHLVVSFFCRWCKATQHALSALGLVFDNRPTVQLNAFIFLRVES